MVIVVNGGRQRAACSAQFRMSFSEKKKSRNISLPSQFTTFLVKLPHGVPVAVVHCDF